MGFSNSQGKSYSFYRSSKTKLSRIIFFLLLLIIVMSVVAHQYISNINSDGETHVHRSRSKLDLPNNEGMSSEHLNAHIDELRKIKASVSNELRELESKTKNLQSKISKFHSEIEVLQQQKDNLEKDIKTTKLTLDQLKLEKDELDQRYVPLLKAPKMVLLGGESAKSIPPPASSKSCKMFSCFDYSRCSVLSGFPVYFYDPDVYKFIGTIKPFIKSSVISAFGANSYVVQSPTKACIYVALIGQADMNDPKSLEKTLSELPFWHGDGRNHILLNVGRDSNAGDIFSGVNTGRAMIAQSSFIETQFRDSFDIVIPPSFRQEVNDIWEDLPPLSPIRRKYFVSFLGNYKGNLNMNTEDTKLSQSENEKNNQNNLHDNQQFVGRQLKMVDNVIQTDNMMIISQENAIISSLKETQSSIEKSEIFTDLSCDFSVSGAINGEWSLCGDEARRKEILQQSTFSLLIAPSNMSYISTTIFQIRFYEALMNSAIPVILGDYAVLPYNDIVDWKKAVVVFPKSRSSEFQFLLRTYTENDLAIMKRYGRFYFETYFGTTKNIIETLLAILRTRLNIPALPIQDEPSPSVFNASFRPLKLIGHDPSPETDEVLGPLEAPFSSLVFKQNFTQYVTYEVFNHVGDPFRLFPSTPFEKVLPSESKFIGSSYGFRPINKGVGGSGKEFSESLGGNIQREQFTIVMLTYERETVLISALQRLKGLPYLNKVIVVWNNPVPPPPGLRWPEIHVPIHIIKTAKNSLNNRFLPYDAIETEAILSIDDDAHLRHDEIGMERRKGENCWFSRKIPCLGCKVKCMAYYAYMYSYVMPQAIRDKVDEYINCEDIAMNFLVTSRWTFRCPGCPQTLSNDISHFEERHKCINYFVKVYGYMPLLYTQYRVDSIYHILEDFSPRKFRYSLKYEISYTNFR
ncbi:hypothetical protein KUTeg_000777 [Tegillarca granosa]|uniref:Uncharacterized protein n=1 Tax=Tegillarca granosa TaxID=220873 RepID=A0ABQ9FZU2_TEGGR|nr:hypothetical protein KUTeg_000777 [Tegillarca granosa]